MFFLLFTNVQVIDSVENSAICKPQNTSGNSHSIYTRHIRNAF